LAVVHVPDSLDSGRPSIQKVTEAGSYLRLIDFFITQLKAQGPSRTCNESKEEEEKIQKGVWGLAQVLGDELPPKVETLRFSSVHR